VHLHDLPKAIYESKNYSYYVLVGNVPMLNVCIRPGCLESAHTFDIYHHCVMEVRVD